MFAFAVLEQSPALMGASMLAILELWQGKSDVASGLAVRLGVRLSYIVNVIHCEWILFWLASWGLGASPLPPSFVAALAWGLFVLAMSYVSASILFCVVIYPAESSLIWTFHKSFGKTGI
eukprot:TRINITY_DN54878_c0_g1_i1.p1 TRINITY_DN54878_c0_g1~~TRINITY_DN54878_c0_g1_i1.p1  ORF type:complete len:131 (+),score=14.79 TRINITY_DN54878_c0_g1_i1:34-393(+)